MGNIPMAKTHVIKFGVTKAQREKIESDAQANGYVFLAQYLRDLTLKNNGLVEQKILETNESVKRLLEVLA